MQTGLLTAFFLTTVSFPFLKAPTVLPSLEITASSIGSSTNEWKNTHVKQLFSLCGHNSQSVVSGPAASASPESLLGIQGYQAPPGPAASGGALQPRFEQTLQVILMLKYEHH